MNGFPTFPRPSNEPEFDYHGNPSAREELERHLNSQDVVEIPAVVGGRRIFSNDVQEVRAPHDRGRLLARIHRPSDTDVRAAIADSLKAAREWSGLPFDKRASVFLRAAEIVAHERRHMMTAVTMLGQSKTIDQAEPDAAGELIDFMRFNVFEAQKIYTSQPLTVPSAVNRADWRPLEGFVYAVSPFNFTAIGANLSCGPALMGNVCVWKPSDKSVLANYRFFEILEQAGLPPGVINFVPGDPAKTSSVVLESPDLAGLHFTGSSHVFKSLWRSIGTNIERYRTFPRMVGETGGKDFLIAHPSTDAVAVTTALIRGAFEYQGQKCSATSRAYIPKSLWPAVKSNLHERIELLQTGDVANRDTFMGAVIDGASHDRLATRIGKAKDDTRARIVCGGKSWTDPGWFVEPTVIEVFDPKHELMCHELFGPVLAVFVYDDAAWEETLRLVDSTSDYGLTGSIYCVDRKALLQAETILANAAGNLYVNYKSAGAVTGQQPFGGARASGTNDKAGSWMNLLRWTSPRVIKETYLPEASWSFAGR
ncbi:L-glutamate gamma-semialdehyde dehydrogenase [Bradyrhizobium sp. 4]|uniref:L-glutamate gamma-semialdehyde dehydrogenase n=1 Tax=unclassified Bradyrhizobium TaxID=2631580 RepID=UPI001FFAE810|nr:MULTISPECIES: L-glutamate gamma-semialdehyde dehydrogenase [unclassified Bradyrhizobium]MCK1402304.1 L-glutamate gamma-semialdehyde dehydrogenase [Bradyrhizobium sp. 39]MCK1632596.1 L-glutamate gamma-semialdehyde dehydrogenase [Bradyrhizobium sp. 162]MCK1750162.1 L-glutamate gamma-semialdehyde dehydrogenase [Bradyrhizobium sp. 135]UPJ36391.1 L-glutamate gamma-semialdehyde dehydrogenase [Bradyrhizobium sp. 4]